MVLWALVPGHPFDLLYTFGFRHLSGGPRLPKYPFPRRFACLMATVMLSAAALAFQFGSPLPGQVIGWSIVVAAFVNVSTGFCIPSFIYGRIFGKPTSCD